ncbi:MAG: hypothetical protein GXX96_30465 [Planctomycetaceae bacterium]|jgi:predicted ATP-grasp superfamily ATP-dependent carboligase|nr:hypothetical protein [Planctomycetaceae bacterium]
MSAIDEFEEMVEAEVAKTTGRDPIRARQKAICTVVQNNHDLHKQYLAEVNADRKGYFARRA